MIKIHARQAYRGSRTIPDWLKRDPDKQTKRIRRNILYFLQLWLATPVWADMEKIKAVYVEANRRKNNGEDVEVDHMVPINHTYVCGLHCEFNLQILDSKHNLHKANNYWPDMPSEQLSLGV